MVESLLLNKNYHWRLFIIYKKVQKSIFHKNEFFKKFKVHNLKARHLIFWILFFFSHKNEFFKKFKVHNLKTRHLIFWILAFVVSICILYNDSAPLTSHTRPNKFRYTLPRFFWFLENQFLFNFFIKALGVGGLSGILVIYDAGPGVWNQIKPM